MSEEEKKKEINDILIKLTDAIGYTGGEGQDIAFHKAYNELINLLTP